jgi:lambda family phage tail tape measure protein
MAVVGSLSVKLGLVTADWDKATDKAKKQALDLKKAFDNLGVGLKDITGLWRTLGGSLAIGSAGITALISQTAAFADKIQDLAEGMEVSTGFALQFSDALTKAGGSSDAAAKVIGKLYENIEKARDGNQETVDQFRQLGIAFKEIKELKPEDAIRRVIAELSKIDDTTKRISEMRKVLGKGGLGLDVRELNAVLEGGIGKWEEYGEGLKQFSKLQDQLIASTNNLMIAFANLTGKFVGDLTISVEKFTGVMAGLATYFVASRIIAYSAAVMGFVTAVRAATAAGVAFNIMASGSPLMLALKLASMGAAFIIYHKYSSDSSSDVTKPVEREQGDMLDGSENFPVEVGNLSKDAKDKLKDDATKQEIAARIASQVEKIKTLNTLALNAVPLWDSFSKSIVSVGVESSNSLQQLNVKRAELQDKYKDSPALLGAELGKLKEQEKQIISNTQRKIAELQYQREITELTQEQVRQEGYRGGIVKMAEDETKRRLDQATVNLSIQERQIDNQLELNKLAIEGSATMSQFAKTMVTQTLETERTLDKLRMQLKALPEYIDMPEDMLTTEAKANNQRIEAIQKQMEFEQARHDLKMANLQNERTYEFGYNQAMTSYVEGATNAAKMGADSFNALTSNMNSALDNFVKTGKLSFKSLARSIIQDLIAIQMRAAASKILMSFFGGGYNQGGVVLGMPAYADGGSPAVGKPSIVGERGPELFVPSGSGTIVPNHALGGMGNTTNVTNNYINAIDTKSFEQRLLGSSNAVWAANTYANKTLATGRGRA